MVERQLPKLHTKGDVQLKCTLIFVTASAHEAAAAP